MAELVLKASGVPAFSPPRLGGRKHRALLRRSGTQLFVHLSEALKLHKAAACRAQWPPARPRRSYEECGRLAGQNPPSDSEAFLPAINVAEPQVDVCANALQGLQLQGATKILRIGPGRGQPEAKAGGSG